MLKKILWFLCLPFFVITAAAQGLTGAWSGKLSVQGMQLTLVLHVSKDAAGKDVCTIDSPDQSVRGMLAEVNLITDDSLSISVPMIGAAYAGKLEGGVLKGVFRQVGYAFPLNLERGEAPIYRPQEPSPPYPYETKEVTFTNPAAGATLSGTLCYPKATGGKRKVPVVLMVSGSGQQNRDEEIFDHKPFLVIADCLAQMGIASLRYDDRGTGKSTGDASRSTMFDNAADALAGLQYLRSQSDFGPVGILGHSEGGCIAFILAAQGKADFIVSLAGSGVKGDSILVEQLRVMLGGQGPQAETDAFCKVMKAVYAYKASHPQVDHPDEVVNNILQQTQTKLNVGQKSSIIDFLKSDNPWLQSFISTDMADYVKQTRCPVMAVNGEKDVQVAAKPNLDAFRRLLPANKLNLIREYAGLNHLFQHCTTGKPTEYRQIDETISFEVVQDIIDWIKSLSAPKK
ncbi:alpha/beta fold hydrolase [Alloprevotella tannerae]|uniref:alpha/beta hydrolase n=1 Tax=Alloprevotella tannerae TaxID=76122 RepID=UPI0028EA89A3|nr:alpha/beta fold hydrolase [Alloprevotella tannerae]